MIGADSTLDRNTNGCEAAQAKRFRRLARDYERLPETLAGLHFVVFTILMLGNAASIFQSS
ncbi:transposase [Pseudoxanthomonas broegbernensis]|nr:transposase [Pseudoxanthomonas broegbernensis]